MSWSGPLSPRLRGPPASTAHRTPQRPSGSPAPDAPSVTGSRGKSPVSDDVRSARDAHPPPMETGVTAPGWQHGDEQPGPGVAVRDHDRIRQDRGQCGLARLSFALAGLAVVVLLVFAGLRSIAMLGVGLGAAAVSLAAAYSALSHRGLWRWLALAVFVLAPIAVIIVYAF